MARGKGTANLAASLEVLAGAPLDARDVCPTVADLYVAANWPYKYIGMKTTVQATGDTYRLVNLDVTQESSWVLDGGSGSSGHTIEGDGTAVTDRDTLNFKDMSVSDDSQNEKTDVKPHRLTAEELADIVYPKPFFDFSNPGAEAFIFSTNERVIGQWVDGKPLYQKTIHNIQNAQAETQGTSVLKYVPLNVSIETIVDIKTMARTGGNGNNRSISSEWHYHTDHNSDINYYDVCVWDNSAQSNANSIRIANMSPSTNNFVFDITILYTKTTDTAVSTGEKIVGQWIDGKPVYEKNFEITITGNLNTPYYHEIGASVDKFIGADAFLIGSSGTQLKVDSMYISNAAMTANETKGIKLAYNRNAYQSHPNTITVYFTTDAWINNVINCTLRYTKV